MWRILVQRQRRYRAVNEASPNSAAPRPLLITKP